jgi:hypothetical protein
VLNNHPHGPLLHFRRKLRYFAHRSILSTNGASGNPGAVHFIGGVFWLLSLVGLLDVFGLIQIEDE